MKTMKVNNNKIANNRKVFMKTYLAIGTLPKKEVKKEKEVGAR